MNRASFLATAAGALVTACWPESLLADEFPLPKSTIFKGESKYNAILAKAKKENWKALPIGERMVKVAMELHGTPYKSYTLEIHDRIESPSANLDGLDCWTFFEICMGMARMMAHEKAGYRPEDLLYEIQLTRYRGGKCTGDYLERIHYLAEWFFDNEARGTCENITRDLGHAQRITGRKCQEMTKLWKSYRYLKNNPSLLKPMAQHEARISALPVYYIPKSHAAKVESKLKNGDVIGVVTKYQGGFCSHVGLAIRTKDGVMRIMHASSNYKRVVVDKSVSGYLNEFSSHAGMIVGRPQEVDKTITDPGRYRANLASLIR